MSDATLLTLAAEFVEANKNKQLPVSTPPVTTDDCPLCRLYPPRKTKNK